MPRINHDEYDPIRIKEQNFLIWFEEEADCRCGDVISTRTGYRCLYCNEWFCVLCAEEHFGQTREEWKAKQK